MQNKPSEGLSSCMSTLCHQFENGKLFICFRWKNYQLETIGEIKWKSYGKPPDTPLSALVNTYTPPTTLQGTPPNTSG